MHGRARRLSKFPRNRLVEDDLAVGRVSELDLLLSLGEPTQQTEADDPNPTFWWDLEWPCGLLTALQFEQLSERLLMKLDQPEVAHALFHLAIEVRDLQTLEEVEPERFAQVAAPPERTWELLRRDAEGHVGLVAGGLTQREADCRRESAAADDPGAAFAVRRQAG